MNEKMKGIVAILDIFSGRPNPMWVLSKPEIVQLQTYLKNLDPARLRKPFGLGYRGFTILNNEPEDNEVSSNFPAKIVVHDGVLAIWAEGKLSYWKDSNGLENWLLKRVREYSRKQKLGLEEILPK